MPTNQGRYMSRRTNVDRIMIAIERIAGQRFYVDSNDLPELNLVVEGESNLTVAVPNAIKYIYKNNRGLDVRVLMEVPVLDAAAEPEPVREVEVIKQAA